MPRVRFPHVALSLIIFVAGARVSPQEKAPAPSQGGQAKHHRATLSWNAPAMDKAAPVTSYRIYRAPATLHHGKAKCTRKWVLIGSTVGPNTQYIDENVQAGSAYCYAVSAVNSRGESPKSQLQTAIIPRP